MHDSPFTISVWDKEMRRVGFVGDPIRLSVTPKWLLPGSASLEVHSGHRRLPDLLADGARVEVERDGEYLLGGRITRDGGEFRVASSVTLGVEDDFALVHQVLGWPNPAGGITEQGADEAYYTLTGPVETVVKGVATANLTRLAADLPMPVTVAPDQGRGPVVTAAIRMHPWADRLLPLAQTAGVGITVRRAGTGLVLDVTVPPAYPRVLTATSGVITGGTWERNRATATRAVVGGQGVGTARQFLTVVDRPLELALGRVIEVFVDARDTDSPAVLLQRGQQRLAEATATSAVDLDLTETGIFSWTAPRESSRYRVGTAVRVQPLPGVVIEDRITEVGFLWDHAAGERRVPHLGGRTADIHQLAAALAAVGRGMRDLAAGR